MTQPEQALGADPDLLEADRPAGEPVESTPDDQVIEDRLGAAAEPVAGDLPGPEPRP